MCGAFAIAAKENWPIHTVIHMVLATNRTGLMSPIQQILFFEIGPKGLFVMSTFCFIIGRTLAKKGI